MCEHDDFKREGDKCEICPDETDGNKSALSVGLYAVLTFDDKGGGGIGGQTVGADGSGTYGVIFEADTIEKAANAAVEYLKEMQTKPQYHTRIKNMNIAYGEGYLGAFVKKISI